MAKAEIKAGICGFRTLVKAKMNNRVCNLTIESDCKYIQRLAQHLKQADPLQEISFHGSMPQTMQMNILYCPHAACPVAVGIVKAIEVEARLAIPADVSIRLFK